MSASASPSLPPPKVSVVIPVYNVEEFLADTIRSVIGQTYQDFEILLVVDGSPDRSIDICCQFAAIDPRVRILEQENRGLAGARNTGIRHARGTYIGLLDGDDQWEPDKLAKHVAHLDADPSLGVSFSRSSLFGGHSPAYLMSYTGLVDGKRLLCRNPISNGSTPVIRREALEAVKEGDSYFDERFRRAEDLDLWLRIVSLTSWRFEGLPEALTRYRVNAGGLSASVYKQLQSWDDVVAKARTYAPDLIKRWGRLGRAYQFRYLAQKAIMIGDGSAAINLASQALASDLGIFAEPRGTILTLLAACLLWLLPRPLYEPLQQAAFRIRTWTQKQQIRREANALEVGSSQPNVR